MKKGLKQKIEDLRRADKRLVLSRGQNAITRAMPYGTVIRPLAEKVRATTGTATTRWG